MEEEQTGINLIGFVLDERPVVFVRDHSANRQFLKGIDPLYWDYLARAHGDQLGNDNQTHRQRAVTALRLGYGQGLETMFALLAALVQVPSFPLAWVAMYHNRELRSVVRKIHTGGGVLSPLKRRATWRSLSEVVHAFLPEPPRAEAIENFAALWGRLAEGLLGDAFEPEYNSLKHGMRALVGGFSVALGPEHLPGVPTPPEKMQTIGSTEYGSTFWMPPDRVEGFRHAFNFGRTVSSAWVPEHFVTGLQLIGMSIRNVVSRALIEAGEDPTTLQFVWPSDPEFYSGPWRTRPSLTHLSMGNGVDLGDWTEPSPDEIRRIYQRGTDDASGS